MSTVEKPLATAGGVVTMPTSLFTPICSASDLSIKLDATDPDLAVACRWMEASVGRARMTGFDPLVVGPLRTLQGIDLLVRNLLAHPGIRHLRVVGPDLSPGKRVSMVLGRLFTPLGDLDHADVQPLGLDVREPFFRYLRGHVRVSFEEDSPLNLDGHESTPTFAPLLLPPPRPTARSGPGPVGDPGQRVVGDGVGETWIAALRETLRFGTKIASQYGDAIELPNLVSVVQKPLVVDEVIPADFPWSRTDVEAYSERFKDKEPPEGAPYSYGSRMRGWSERDGENEYCDQLRCLDDKLKSDQGSRALFATPWFPWDARRSSGQPCLVGVQFRVLDFTLHGTLHFRSHDLFGAWPINIGGFGVWMNRLASHHGFRLGTVTCLSTSAHLYERDRATAEALVATHRSPWPVFDRRGHWRIERVETGFRAMVYAADSDVHPALVLEAPTVGSLAKQVEQSGYVTSTGNAIWIGRELERVAALNV